MRNRLGRTITRFPQAGLQDEERSRPGVAPPLRAGGAQVL